MDIHNQVELFETSLYNNEAVICMSNIFIMMFDKLNTIFMGNFFAHIIYKKLLRKVRLIYGSPVCGFEYVESWTRSITQNNEPVWLPPIVTLP